MICSFWLFYGLQNLRKTKHHLSHDRVRTGMGLFLIWRHELLCMHVYKDLRRCKSVCDVKSRIVPCPSLARSCNRWWLEFVPFTAYKKSKLRRISLKKDVMLFEQVQRVILAKKYFGVRCTLTLKNRAFCSFNYCLVSCTAGTLHYACYIDSRIEYLKQLPQWKLSNTCCITKTWVSALKAEYFPF